MILEIPEHIENRIRRPPPLNVAVDLGSTPVLSFGDALRAAAATLGLKLSRVEFLDVRTSNLNTACIEIVAKVLEHYDGYVRRWFDKLLPILTDCGASYFDGTACHVDLVEWATNKWDNCLFRFRMGNAPN